MFFSIFFINLAQEKYNRVHYINKAMKKIIFLLTIILFAISSTAMAQQERSDKKSTKEAEKEAKKAQKEAKRIAEKAEKLVKYEEAVDAMNNRKFLYKIDRAQINNGRFYPTDNRSSFFELNDTVTASQIDAGSTFSTPKIVYGSISDFKSSTDKKGTLTIKFVLREKTNIFPKNITMRLENESNECSMTIAEKKGTRIYLRGTIVPIGSEIIFKGTPVVY